MEEFKKGALNLAWGLATTVPPHVPSCEFPEFDERIHECLPKSINDRETACILKYSRPILFANCMGQFVIAKGYVSEVPIEVDKAVSGKRLPVICCLYMYRGNRMAKQKQNSNF